MQPPASITTWIEGTRLALYIGESMWIIASLSALHVLGFTLSLGSALVLNGRLAGLMLGSVPMRDLAGEVSRGITAGLILSITTGMLLASWKLGAVLASSIFQVKMALLVAAAALHFLWLRPRMRGTGEDVALRLPAVLALVLWLGLGVAGCAFILFE